MGKSSLTVWEVEEILEDGRDLNSEMYEKDEVDELLSNVEDDLFEALKKIEDIGGIDIIDDCKDLLKKAIRSVS